MVDYSKWDMVDAEEEEKEARGLTPELLANHGESMRRIKEGLARSYPRLDDEALSHTLEFVRVQHRGIHPTNARRHLEITAFLERAAAEGGKGKPSVHALLALGYDAKARAESADEAERSEARATLPIVMGALNTLAACDREGGARALFEQIQRRPDGEVGVRYRELQYAIDLIGSPPPDPLAPPPPPDEPGLEYPIFGREWWARLAKGLALQLAVFAALVSCMWAMGVMPPLRPADVPDEGAAAAAGLTPGIDLWEPEGDA